MLEEILLSLTAVAILGIGAQWLGWRLRTPPILPLLVFGIIAGPVTGVFDPDRLMGDLLYPVVSLAVAIILFEGGLSLSIKELRAVGATVARLVTIGMLVSWLLTATLAHYLIGIEWQLAVLLGATLVVTGPTVIVPLLRVIRPSGIVGSVLKWEGIVIDPIGAMLAVLVFQFILIADQDIGTVATDVVLKTLAIGTALGGAGALFIVQTLKHDWAPDYLQNPVTLMVVVSTYTASNLLQAESGLLSVTLMGFILANQRGVAVRHIIEFKENLRVLLIATVFILLAAHLKPDDLRHIGFGHFVFLAALVVLVRPLSVLIATLGSRLTREDRLFIAAIAPRGIVAAAVASVFTLRLEETGYAGADQLVATTFLVIIGTVTFYSITAERSARRLGLLKDEPDGVLLLGGHDWVREIGKVLTAEGIPVMLVDNNRAAIRQAKLDGVPAFYASVFSEAVLEQVELGGIGRLLALTQNDDINSLAALHFAPVFGRNNIFQLSPGEKAAIEESSLHLRGRTVFSSNATHRLITRRFLSGWTLKCTRLGEEFDFKDFLDHYDDQVLPLFVISENGRLQVFVEGGNLKPAAGQMIVALINPRAAKGTREAQETAKG